MSFYKFDKILANKNLNQLNHNGYRKLIHVRIEPTEVCNFSCKFCVTQDAERIKTIQKEGYNGNNRKFNKERLLNLLDELKTVGVKAISFVAVGDPLMFPGIDEVIKKSVKLKFDLGLTSNFGMPLKDDLLNDLTNFSWIRWSMNGGSKEVYLKTNNPRGKNASDAYENAKNNISKLIKFRNEKNSKTLVNASYVVSKWNSKDVVNAAELGKNLNINNLFFRPDMLPMNERSEIPLDILKSNEKILNEAKNYSDKNFKVHVETERENDVLKVDDDNLVCFYSNHSIYIAANGDVYPCCYTRINPKFVVGNISDKNFEDFWKDKNNCENYKKVTMNTCPSCPYSNINKNLKEVYNGNEKNIPEVNFVDNFV